MSSGNLYIVSAPSGAGKTSLLNVVKQQLSDLKVAVSHTTRSARPGEVDGQHYHFVSKSEFQTMVAQDEFIEFAEVFGNFYGTSKLAIKSIVDTGQHVVLEIDWQGARQVRISFPDAISIFILPPSIDELQKRLSARGQDSEEIIAGRMSEAQAEISHYDEYQYLVINDDLATAQQDLIRIFSEPEAYIPPSENKLNDLLGSLVQN